MSISAVIKRVALLYSIILLGTYAVAKVLTFFEFQSGLLETVQRVAILPMGCMVVLYLFASSRVLLEEIGIHHRLYEVLILIFGMLVMALFFFVAFLPS